ncbi:hypothetical protein CC80DRAFT_47780 [Byssothecium circinans]|uniref:CRIB domain-containing protein n=1 Tax=Byssothecium circinans TaxID=147558 RepID=A0A6A5TY82_9PLEO|nr:hypothetical protein CC80DRAFT_47780 [Byssothecium circinans]
MFTLNKSSPLPSSKQSSVDSLVTDISASNSNLWPSLTSDTSSYADVPSPEHSGAHASKRNSVFNLRNRTNTSTSTNSSFVAVTPPNMQSHESTPHRLSQDIRQLAGQSFMEINGAKRSFFGGKKGKRLSGSFASSLHSPESEEVDGGGKRMSVLRKAKRPSNQSGVPVKTFKHRISSPFDFQHLTHTDRHQFAAMQQASKDELVTEYWAARASQAPRRDLTGIKAEDLHGQNFSSDSLGSDGPRPGSALRLKSPASAGTLVEHEPSPSSEQPTGRPPLRSTRSVESFSRPGVNPRTHRHTQSANPPPRMSSRQALTPMNHLPEEATDAHRTNSPPSRRQSGVWDHLAPLSPTSPRGHLPTMMEESDYVGHALTTPDNSAIHAMTPPFSPGLDDVAEEPERFVSPRPAPRPPVKSSRSPKSPSFDNFSFSNPRSPIAKTHSRKPSYPSPKSFCHSSSITRPISQASDTLGSAGLSRKNSIRRAPSTRRTSNTWRVIEESWEDDIDYIYDNALEADCDFDWDRTSLDGSYEDRDRTPEQQDHQRTSASNPYGAQKPPSLEGPIHFQSAQRPTLVVPSVSHLPELESRSASTIDTRGAQTPSDYFNPVAPSLYPSNEAEGFSLNPSLLVPADFKEELSRDEMYEDLLADYDGSDRHFHLLESTQSVASSTRSSNVRSSKRSSYDSSLMSSGHISGSGSWTSGVRRSASSSGSLPDLVHSSRHARRDFNAVVDRLSEQVASFTSFNEDDTEQNEDDETTPPGHGAQQRTFFAEDDERTEHDNCRRGSVEADVKSSLELARQGSTRSSRVPLFHHKYASSDGAAKILTSASQTAPERQSCMKSRQRAASQSTTQPKPREQHFSLFPAPPKKSPLTTPTSPLSPSSNMQ